MKAAYAGFDLLDTALESMIAEGCTILEVFTCPVDQETEFNSHVKQIAETLHIPCTEKPIRPEDIRRLKEQGCELLISAGYYFRIPVEPGMLMFNIHPSLLPEGRGAWPMPVMLLEGQKQGGVTLHRLEEDFDAGDIVWQAAFDIGEKDTLEDLTRKIREQIPEMLHELLRDPQGAADRAVRQQGGSFWPCPHEEDFPIFSSMTVEEADRILRAFYGFGCIYQKEEERWLLIRGRACSGGAEDRKGRFSLKDGWIQAEKADKL
ncbi:MAG: formyltransferase family protein [Eubacteriales bacterium]|nr:formyltransferase family protein [Eubacteriales bacterium]